MSDCPLGCGWRMNWSDPPVYARPAGRTGPPFVWDGTILKQALMSDPPVGWGYPAATHICREHADLPAVQALGPVEFSVDALGQRWAPPSPPKPEPPRPWWRRLLSV